MGLFALFISCKGNVSQTDKPQPVNLILDTDLGPDYDDVGAMALMHALADSGQVNILATLSSNHDERVVPCIGAEYLFQPSGHTGRGTKERTGGLLDYLA